MSAADIASAASATDEKLRRDKLVTENLGLVHLCANRFRGRGVEYEELYSSGCVGLVKAAGAFDEERGVKFSTYAVPVILGEIKRVFRDGGTVKVSRSLKELSMKVTREKADFILKNGREPTVCELADIMGESAENIAEALSAALPCISLTGGDDEDGRQQDIPSPFREADIYEGILTEQLFVLVGQSHNFQRVLDGIGLGCPSQLRKNFKVFCAGQIRIKTGSFDDGVIVVSNNFFRHH